MREYRLGDTHLGSSPAEKDLEDLVDSKWNRHQQLQQRPSVSWIQKGRQQIQGRIFCNL